jgi:hypothetical protein
MSAIISPFRRPQRQPPRRGASAGIALTLQARHGSVTLTADDLELGLSAAEARELARDLLELADDADGAT